MGLPGQGYRSYQEDYEAKMRWEQEIADKKYVQKLQKALQRISDYTNNQLKHNPSLGCQDICERIQKILSET